MTIEGEGNTFIHELTTLTDLDWAALAAEELNRKNKGSGRQPLRPEDAIVTHTDRGTVRCIWRLGRDQ